METDLFTIPETTEIFLAIVVLPNNVDSMRKSIASLYDAKLWISDKIWGATEKVGNKFPFGYDYAIVTKDDILMPDELNLGY